MNESLARPTRHDILHMAAVLLLINQLFFDLLVACRRGQPIRAAKALARLLRRCRLVKQPSDGCYACDFGYTLTDLHAARDHVLRDLIPRSRRASDAYLITQGREL